MLLEALDAEELLADRLLAIPRYGLRRAPEGAQNGFQPALSWGMLRGNPRPPGVTANPPARGKDIMTPAASRDPCEIRQQRARAGYLVE
jgi:hypothetical protein